MFEKCSRGIGKVSWRDVGKKEREERGEGNLYMLRKKGRR